MRATSELEFFAGTAASHNKHPSHRPIPVTYPRCQSHAQSTSNSVIGVIRSS
jgi:hypothetical protein